MMGGGKLKFMGVMDAWGWSQAITFSRVREVRFLREQSGTRMAELMKIHDMSEILGGFPALIRSFGICLVAVWSFGFR